MGKQKTEFPLFKTKTSLVRKKYNLADPQERLEYFHAKAGNEIERLRKYLKRNTFIAYMLAKKAAGKGTYARILMEIFGNEQIAHLSVGDVVREVDGEIGDPKKRKELEEFLRKNYRGFHSLEEIIKAQEERSTKTLLPAEFILALIEREIDESQKKAIFIDGFPRDLDQVSYSLFFRALVGYRDDPDFFILIQVPEAVIDERLKYRVVCPQCRMSRNIKLHPTKEVGYDAEKDLFYLKCENPACQGERMAGKEGDELGIENIRQRLTDDQDLMSQAISLYGIPKILLRNAVPVRKTEELVDDYEITPEYVYSWDKTAGKVVIKEKPWVIKDDRGVNSHSLLAPVVVVSLIKQMAEVLGV